MNDIMIDLETLDTKPSAAILSIGAVFFSQKGLGREFYCTVSLDSSIAAGLTVSGSTFLWWMKQEKEARKALFMKNIPLVQALMEFSDWVKEHSNPDHVKVWGNGAAFDNAIMEHAYSKLDMTVPWQFYNDRCYRTTCDLLNAPKREQTGVHHNALDDAKSQAVHLVALLNARALW